MNMLAPPNTTTDAIADEDKMPWDGEPPPPSPAERMMALFAGADTHYGTYDHRRASNDVEAGKKVEIKSSATTEKNGGATVELWEAHLNGAKPLGVSPLIDRRECVWGVIDIDQYDVDPVGVVARIEKGKLPLVPCRSKSGGMHLFCFSAEPVTASSMQQALRRMAGQLGLKSGTEIFPKQNEDSTGYDYAGWLNMPYFEAEQTRRHGFDRDGGPLGLNEFLRRAEAARTSPEELGRLAAPPGELAAGAAPSSPTSAEFEALLNEWLEKLENSPGGTADNTLLRIARDIGRWRSGIEFDEAAVEQRVREAWYRRGKNDDDFDKCYARNVEWGRRAGNPSRLRGRRPLVRRMSEFQVRSVDWLWEERLALGKLSVIAGQPGLGKSQLTMFVAAQVTTGGQWPFGEGWSPRGRVLVMSAEDDPSDTLVPRFVAAGGDIDQIDILEGVRTERGEVSIDLSHDIPALDQVLGTSDDYRLLIIDPISAYLGQVDSNSNTKVRDILKPLQKLAERHRVAVLAVTHLAKGGNRPAVEAVSGSLGFAAAARCVLIVTREMEEEKDDDGGFKKVETGRRIVSVAKNNLGPDGSAQSMAYRIGSRHLEHGIRPPVIEWDEKVDISADDALGHRSEARPGRPPKKQEQAEALLRRMLKGGPVATTTLDKAAEAEGISLATLKIARKKLGVKSERPKGTADGPWQSFLPGRQEEMPI